MVFSRLGGMADELVATNQLDPTGTLVAEEETFAVEVEPLDPLREDSPGRHRLAKRERLDGEQVDADPHRRLPAALERPLLAREVA